MAKKTRTGTVVSTKMINTVTVAVTRKKEHPLYRKQYQVTEKFHADTAGEAYELGDKVQIEETRPISKTKSWRAVTKVS